MKRHQGFTVIELIITLGIMAMVFMIALPNFQALVARNSADKFRDDLYSDLVLARSEAMSRNRLVTICASTNPMAVTPTCAANGVDWNTGWIVFSDTNGNRVLDAGVDKNGNGHLDIPADEIIRVYENLAEQNATVEYNGAAQHIVFDRLGRMESGSNGSFLFCSTLHSYYRNIVINRTGRPYYSEGSAGAC